jgi:hypothetical protein
MKRCIHFHSLSAQGKGSKRKRGRPDVAAGLEAYRSAPCMLAWLTMWQCSVFCTGYCCHPFAYWKRIALQHKYNLNK